MVALWRPDLAIQVAFSANPNSSAVPTWTDLTSLFRRASNVRRGKQYELDQNQGSQPSFVWLDPNEYLNPANSGSPYSPNVLPFRQILWQAMWPNGGTGNLLNTGAQGTSYDPSFESYTTGAAVSWLTAVGGTSPVVGTTTPHGGTKDVTWTVVNGATIQGVSWVLPCIPGRQYTTSAYVRQSSASTQQIAVTGVATGSSTSTTGAYVRLTVTFTAAQPSHTVTVQTTGTAVAGTVLLDDVQHEPGASANAFTTTGPVIYGILREYVERWPAKWDYQGFLGYCEATLVDAFAPQTKTTLWTEYRNSVMAKAPAYYWPLSEPSGATAFAEVSGNAGPYMVRLDAPRGPATTFAAGTSTGIAGDPGGVGVETVSTAPAGSALQATAGTAGTLSLAASAAPWALSAAFWFTANNTGNAGFMFTIFNYASWSDQAIALYVSQGPTSTQIEVGVSGPSGAIDLQDVASNAFNGSLHHIVATVNFASSTSATYVLWVDGTQLVTRTFNPTTVFGANLNMTCSTVQVGADMGPFFPDYDGQSGTYAHVSIWRRVLSNTEIADLWNAGKGYPGETSGARITRYLGYAWQGLSSIDTGQSVMGVSDLAAGTTLLAACQAVTTTENGNYFQDPRGYIRFASRQAAYLATTSKWTFGENVAGGEFPYLEDITFELDPTLIYNDVTVTNSGGIVAHAVDTNSQAEYFPNAYSRTVNVSSNNEAIDAANYLLNQHAQPSLRVSQITLDPVGNPNLWPVVLSIELGDRVTVKRRPKAANNNAGITMSADFFVGQISHDGIDMDAGTWTTALLLYPVDLVQVGVLDSATLGLLDSTMVLAY